MDLTVEKLSEILSQADPMQLVSRDARRKGLFSRGRGLGLCHDSLIPGLLSHPCLLHSILQIPIGIKQCLRP